MKFSVILPLYINVQLKTFQKSFQSILNQTLKPNEIILILDGPIKDEIKKFILKKKKTNKSIKILTFNRNHGLGYVLNKAIKKCKYNIIARCDADDFSNKKRFQIQIDFLKKNKNIDVLGSNINEVNNSKIISRKFMVKEDYKIKKQLLFRNPINHSSVMFKKNKVLKSGNYQQVQYFEDYYMWFAMAKKNCNFRNLPSFLVSMSVDDDFYTRRSGLKYYKYYLNFILKIKKNFKTNTLIIMFNIILRLPMIFLHNKIIKILYSTILRN